MAIHVCGFTKLWVKIIAVIIVKNVVFKSIVLTHWHKSKLMPQNINGGVNYEKLKHNICNSDKTNWTSRE